MRVPIHFIYTLQLALLCLSKVAWSDPALSATFAGGLKVEIALGNIVTQPVQGIIVSHWPDGVNDGGGVGGAIVSDPAGAIAVDSFSKIMEEKGSLPYTEVFSTNIPENSNSSMKAKTLLNVIELRPSQRIDFNSQQELEQSDFPFTDSERKKYSSIIQKYESSIQELNQVFNGSGGVTTIKESDSMMETKNKFIQEQKKITRTFYNEKKSLIDKYLKNIGFETTALTVKNALLEASAKGISSVAVPTLGYGIMGDLSPSESIASILTGAQMYANEAGDAGNTKELKIVLYMRDSTKGRKYVVKNFGKLFNKGEFFDVAKSLWPRVPDAAFDMGKAKYLTLNPVKKSGFLDCIASLFKKR